MKEIRAPMGGKLLKVWAKVGEMVTEDDEMAVLEAMKMEMPILYEEDGKVAEVKVTVGQTVDAGQVLIILD